MSIHTTERIEQAAMSHHSSSESAVIFPFFRLLPYELREQIWEMATSMAAAAFKCPRIHYYSLFDIDDYSIEHSGLLSIPGIVTKKPSPPIDETDGLKWPIQTDSSIQRRPQNTAWARANRFRGTHNRDGLLMACSESRHVYLRRFEKFLPAFQQLSLRVISSNDGHNEVYTQINELQDVFCLSFSAEDLEAAAIGLQWDVLLSSLPFFSTDTIQVVNIAFEFESSWNENLPDSWNTMRCEPSPRGLFARALWAWAHGELPEQTRVWLIDRTWKPPMEYFLRWRGITSNMMPGDLAEERPKFFTDDRSVYMEIKPWRDDSPEFAASAAALIWRFRIWYSDLRHEQAQFIEEELVSSWQNLPWKSPLCGTALFEVPAHKVEAWSLFWPRSPVTPDT